ncbi:hypothetical protein EG329_010236 [Mollisiaceae sp. DMI_Dod_QoI]|nr:hypothetical protein EG329_010236 [Helotiales sp. DMI_Dod_QoI]
MDTSESTSALPSSANEELSPLEQDVLDEYERLAENMKKARQSLCANASLSKSSRYHGRETCCRDIRWVEAVREEDEFSVHVVEG